jgi:hypothetical protein
MAKRKPGGPADAHYDLVDERCYEVVARAIGLLEARRARYVLTGGWAVYAYGSRVPSVDTDVLLEEEDGRAIVDAVRAVGITVGPGEQFEPMPLDGASNILGPDPDLQEADRGYVPRKLLKLRTTKRELDLGKHGKVVATVPNADALAFMKLKAYHNRELQWRAHRDPAVMARIPTMDRGQVMGKTVDYFYRKAGKDLYDIAFLLAHHADQTNVRHLAEETGLHNDLAPLLMIPPQAPLLFFARAMANQERDEPTLAILRQWGAPPIS